jgi:hypothetical protein
MYSNRCLYCE